MKKKNLILIGLVTVLTCALVGCGGSKEDETTTDNVVAVEELPTDNEVDISDLPTKDEADEADATEQDETDEAEAEGSIVDVADGIDTTDEDEDVKTAILDAMSDILAASGLPTENVADSFVDSNNKLWVLYEDGTMYRIEDGNHPVEQYGFDDLEEVRKADTIPDTIIVEPGEDYNEALRKAGVEVIDDFHEVDVSDWYLPEDRPRFGGR